MCFKTPEPFVETSAPFDCAEVSTSFRFSNCLTVTWLMRSTMPRSMATVASFCGVQALKPYPRLEGALSASLKIFSTWLLENLGRGPPCGPRFLMAIPANPSALNLRIHFLMLEGCAASICPISTAVFPSEDRSMTAALEASSLLCDSEQRLSSSLSSGSNSRTNSGWNMFCALRKSAPKLLRQ